MDIYIFHTYPIIFYMTPTLRRTIQPSTVVFPFGGPAAESHSADAESPRGGFGGPNLTPQPLAARQEEVGFDL
jgi:hypothetical protein